MGGKGRGSGRGGKRKWEVKEEEVGGEGRGEEGSEGEERGVKGEEGRGMMEERV